MPKQSLPKQEYPGILIGVARRGIRQAVTAQARRFGLASQQFWALVAVYSFPGMTLSELVERQRFDPPTASRVVTALVRKKLLETRGDAEDRRRMRIWLAPKGETLGPKLHAIALEVRAAIVADMSEDELAALRAGLRKVIANMARYAETHARAPRR
jgi:DNA-binding MarR family transcriptional regulator